MEYKNEQLEAIYHTEGRATRKEDNSFEYQYNIRDNLNNTRVVFRNDGSDTPEIVSKSAYYPYGLQIDDLSQNETPEYRYLFNGMELNDDFGLGMLDFNSRWFDNKSITWWQSDPMAELHPRQSPYSYVLNNPIRYLDPTGMTNEDANEEEDEKDANYYIRKARYEAQQRAKDAEYGLPSPSGVSSAGGEDCCPEGVVKAAEGVLAAMTIDLSVPEPSDAIPVKWLIYGGLAVVGGTIIYLSGTDDGDTSTPIASLDDVSDETDSPIRIALGTDQDLNDFALKVGALPYANWGSYMPENTDGGAYALSLIQMAQAFPNLTFHFNLTDAKTGNRIDKTYQSPLYSNKITSHEFKIVSTLYPDRTTFYIKSGSIYKPIQLK
ncbi:MAG: RHS repeat-associated core domain-containing protein [Bacteroidota bacterium]